MDQKRIVVCGGRDYGEWGDRKAYASDDEWERARSKGIAERAALRSLLDELQPLCIAQGGCPTGADSLARQWARDTGVPCRTYDADWERYGKSAGPRRNSHMLADFQPGRVVAASGLRGTADMVRKAQAAGVPILAPVVKPA